MDGPTRAGTQYDARAGAAQVSVAQCDLSGSGAEGDEREVIDRARVGDSTALGLLFDLHYPRVYSYLRFKVAQQEDAEDLAQEVFVRMINALKGYQHRGAPFRSWLMQIAANLLNDFYRRRGRHAPTWSVELGEIDVASEIDTAERVEVQLTLQEVKGAMGILTEAEREVILLRYSADLSIAETAAATGKNENNVKQLTFKALGKLRKALHSGDVGNP